MIKFCVHCTANLELYFCTELFTKICYCLRMFQVVSFLNEIVVYYDIFIFIHSETLLNNNVTTLDEVKTGAISTALEFVDFGQL